MSYRTVVAENRLNVQMQKRSLTVLSSSRSI